MTWPVLASDNVSINRQHSALGLYCKSMYEVHILVLVHISYQMLLDVLKFYSISYSIYFLFLAPPYYVHFKLLPIFFFYHCMNKRSEIFPRAMNKWLTDTFFDIDSLLIRILKLNFFFMQFYNKWKMINNIDENIKCEQEHYVSDMFFFLLQPQPLQHESQEEEVPRPAFPQCTCDQCAS